jgi:hypothetical protein
VRQIKSEVNGTKEYCPATSVCPKQCPVGEHLCHYAENDQDGCHYEDLCVAIPKDNFNAPCANPACPPRCTWAQSKQDNGIDEKGCPLPETCV